MYFCHKIQMLKYMRNRKIMVFFLSLMAFCVFANAQDVKKSDFQQRAEQEAAKQNIANARSYYLRAFDDYVGRNEIRQGVECGISATALYYKENFWKEAFELLHRVENPVNASNLSEAEKSSLRYLVSKERMKMYMKLRKGESVKAQLSIMKSYADAAKDEDLQNDLLYNQAIYYYTFGQTAQGDAVFKQMAAKLTSTKEYDKVDEVYRTLIENGKKSNNANMVAQSYSNYMMWKDSVSAVKAAEETNALKQRIADDESVIAEKDDSLSSRKVVIVAQRILILVLIVVLALGTMVLLRYIRLTAKQKKTIKQANDNIALKAKFISNISAQLNPTLQKLDATIPEVKALLDFSSDAQLLSELESTADETVETEDVQVQSLCEELMEQIRGKVKDRVTLTVNVQKMSVPMNKAYVEHILSHLLSNAAEFTPAGGEIWIDFKKRSPHKYQFIVSDTGSSIPEEKREEVFRPFAEIKDLTKGDGLGLPICRQMARKMKGDLEIDPAFTKGTRFLLNLNV